MQHVTLNDGRQVPQLGYGVWRIPDEEAARCVQVAIELGYRLIDTAMIYENERGVGKAIRASGVDRDELFVTTKLWNTDHARDAAVRACEASLRRLGLDQVDLYLVHWPAPTTGDFRTAWQSLVELRERGLVRSIGVSNFNVEHLEQVIDDTGVVPAVNQVELHPYFQQRELRAWCREQGIAVEAWGPIGRGGDLLADPTVTGLARALERTPAQVVLRWHLQMGNIVIPKSATPARIAANIDVFDFELSEADMRELDAMDDPAGRLGPDPLTAAF